MPLRPAEIIQHPAFENVIYDLQPAEKGLASVAIGRGGPFNIAYEVHGSGPKHLVWITGLGGFKWYWQRQLKDFGHAQPEKYSCLIFDNRGMGESDKPIMRYSTSELAKDTLEVCSHLGWTNKRDLHVIGISMGGMVAQEMALHEPGRIASLTLLSSAAELINTIGYIEHLRNRINILIPKSIDTQINDVKSHVSDAWLSAPDVDDGFATNFPTNGDRFAAQELKKRRDAKGFTRIGFLCQLLAAAYHRKSPEQLQQLGERVGRARIQAMHGTMDNLITFPHLEILVRGLGGEEGGVTKHVFQGRGHYLPLEEREEFQRLMEVMIEKVEALPVEEPDFLPTEKVEVKIEEIEEIEVESL